MSASLVAWRGPSRWGAKAPIRVVASCLTTHSLNRKTGDVIQVTVQHDLMPFTEAVKTRADDAMCGGCPYRAGDCLVVKGSGAVRTPWNLTNGTPANMGAVCDQIQRSRRAVRFAHVEDIAVVPFDDVVVPLYEASRDSVGRPRFIAHTNLWWWEGCDPRVRQVAMASVHSPKAQQLAFELGWRTFLDMPLGQHVSAPSPTNEIWCPATREGGFEAPCSCCLYCSGQKGRGGSKNVRVVKHGSKGKRGFNPEPDHVIAEARERVAALRPRDDRGARPTRSEPIAQGGQ